MVFPYRWVAGSVIVYAAGHKFRMPDWQSGLRGNSTRVRRKEMANPVVLVTGWLPDGTLSRLRAEFQGLEFVDARDAAVFEKHIGRATVIYGSPSVPSLTVATSLRWLQLMYAGVP